LKATTSFSLVRWRKTAPMARAGNFVHASRRSVTTWKNFGAVCGSVSGNALNVVILTGNGTPLDRSGLASTTTAAPIGAAMAHPPNAAHAAVFRNSRRGVGAAGGAGGVGASMGADESSGEGRGSPSGWVMVED
jgi:hypothetical protein